MNTFIRLFVRATAFGLFVTPLVAQSETLKPMQVTSAEVMWAPTGTGTQLAVLVGNSRNVGMYATRSKLPAHFKNQPHFHPDDRIVTVISGTLYVGYGTRFDETNMKALPPGSIWTEPARQPHFVWAKEGEVIIQAIGNGPSASTPVQSTP